MTTPSIVPTGYAGDSTDFLHAKMDRSGAMRIVTGTVSVPAGTATDTIIGLVPFRKGAKFGYGSRVYVGDMDTSTNVTADIGYVYDDNVTYTNVFNAFVSASTAPQTGGMMEMTSVAGMTWTAAADGWFTAQNNATTTTTASLTFSIVIAYDPSGVTNA